MRRNHLFLQFPLSHLQYIKHFIGDFLRKQLLHLPIEHEQVAIIGLMLSVTASSCQCGTKEPSESAFQLHSIRSDMLVSISLRSQKWPTLIYACFTCWRIPDGDGTSILRFTLGVEIRWSVHRDLNGAYFVKPYASQTKLHNVSNSKLLHYC